MATCHVCFRHCEIEEGQLGFCGARTCEGGRITAAGYGLVTALALDPIEKKPLRNFHPGSQILSVGSYGCNLRCPFCQNNSISWSEGAKDLAAAAASAALAAAADSAASLTTTDSATSVTTTASASAAARQGQPLPRSVQPVTPEELAQAAEQLRSRGNIGIAFTYNEPLVGYEFVRDTAKLVHEMGMKNVLVTNGTCETEVLEELLPWIDAMNIDLKGFDEAWYRRIGGSLEQTLQFIELAAKHCHVELTTLIIPGENDSSEMMEMQADWIAGLTDKDGNTIGRRIPLHITRFFPQFHMTDRPPTDVQRIYELMEIAAQKLDHVYAGNC